MGVSIHWTGLLEWTTGVDYRTHPHCYKIPFKCRTKAKRAHSACYFANIGSLAGRGVFPRVSRGQRSCAYLISFNNWLKPSHIWSRNIISFLYASKQRLEFGFCMKWMLFRSLHSSSLNMHVTFDLNRLQERRLNHILCLNRLREESNGPNELLSYTEKSILLQFGWVQ